MLGLLLMAAVAAVPPNLPPVATVGMTDRPPVIDGGMDDPCWHTAAVIAPLVRLGTADFPSQQTVGRICADQQNIYVAFWCWEDDLKAIRTRATKHDSPDAWSDDCVEIFLAPDDRAETYYHIIVTAANVVTDEVCTSAGQGKPIERDPSWSFGGQSATKRWPLGWTCEVAIPRRSLGAPLADQPWLASFARNEVPHGEQSAWPAMISGFHETDRFGTLLWAQRAVVAGLGLKAILPGVNSVKMTAPAGEPSPTLEITVLPDNAPVRTTEVTSDAEYEFTVNHEGEGFVRLAVLDSNGREAFATAPMHYSVPSLTGKLAATAKRLDWAYKDALAATGMTADLLRQVRKQRDALEKLREDVAAAKTEAASADVWADLEQRTDDLVHQSFALLLRSRTGVRAGAKATFALGWQNSLTKLRRDDVKVNLGGAIQLSASRGEWESAQLVVLPLDKPVRIAKVAAGPLGGADGKTKISGDDVKVWRLDYVKTRPPAYPVAYVGWWPDPLLPFSPVDVQPGELQPIWLDYHVPYGTPAGLYRGEVTVQAADGTKESWPVQLTVWDIDLPWPSRLRTAFSVLQKYDASKWYGWKGLPPESYRRKLYKLLFDHRLNPMSLYTNEMFPPREDLEWCVKHGLNAFNIDTVNGPDKATLDYVKKQADWLRQKGWLRMAYVYGFDEVTPDRYDALRQAYGAVKKAVPDLPRACTVVPNDALKGYVDIWVPLTASYNLAEAEARRKAGDQVWWYICCGPQHPYANWFIDYPATDARVLFWQTFKYHVTGFLYYEISMWRTNLLSGPSNDPTQIPPAEESVRQAIAAGKRWPDVPWNTFTFANYNGDGLLIYPGPNQTPLPSMRLEVIRDGIEDYDLLTVLSDWRDKVAASPRAGKYAALLEKADGLLSVPTKVVRDMTHFTKKPSVILSARQEVAETILKLKAAVR